MGLGVAEPTSGRRVGRRASVGRARAGAAGATGVAQDRLACCRLWRGRGPQTSYRQRRPPSRLSALAPPPALWSDARSPCTVCNCCGTERCGASFEEDVHAAPSCLLVATRQLCLDPLADSVLGIHFTSLFKDAENHAADHLADGAGCIAHRILTEPCDVARGAASDEG